MALGRLVKTFKKMYELLPKEKDILYCTVLCDHRRRIELEDKAKVVGSDWGKEALPH